MNHFLTVLCILCWSISAQAQCYLRIEGTVTDPDTHEMLAGAEIEILNLHKKIVSDDAGNFLFEGMCPGIYDLFIKHINCEPVTLHIHLKDDYKQTIQLSHFYNSLEQVTVSSDLQKQDASASAELKGRELDQTRGLSLGEALKKMAGVSNLQTGTNIYKPVINGLHSSRVLIINNGIRQEGQQWGSEHAPEIDPFIANKLTVIKGAASIRYGGDAIGGVVLVEPKSLTRLPGISGEINSAFFSNNRMGVLSGILEGNLKRTTPLSWRVQGTLKQGGNARTPNYWLENSGLAEYNFSATAGWNKAKWGTELFFSSFDTRIGIFTGSHIGNTSDLINAINSGDPPDYIKDAEFSYTIERPRQQVRHYLLKSNSFIQTGNLGKLNIILATQYNSRQEYDLKKFASSADVPQLDLRISTYTGELVWDHNKWNGFRGSIGISTMYQDNWYQYRLFIPQYKLFNTGLFIMEKWNAGKLSFEAAARYDIRNMYNIFANDGTAYANKNFGNFSGNFGVIYAVENHHRFTANISTGWRAPNVNELYSDGLHHGAARIEKGNASLQAERANSIIAGYQYNQKKWQLETEVFYKHIDNFIFLRPTYPPQLTIRGAFPSFEYAQADAGFYGGDVSLTIQPGDHLNLRLRTTLLWAWNITDDDWLIQMPPNLHEAELQYMFTDAGKWKQTYCKLSFIYTEGQKRIPQKGNIEIKQNDGTITLESDYAPPPEAYLLASFEAGTALQTKDRPISIIVAVNNIFNTVYRNYLNAFRYYADEMGTNISLRLKIPFAFHKHS